MYLHVTCPLLLDLASGLVYIYKLKRDGAVSSWVLFQELQSTRGYYTYFGCSLALSKSLNKEDNSTIMVIGADGYKDDLNYFYGQSMAISALVVPCMKWHEISCTLHIKYSNDMISHAHYILSYFSTPMI